MAAPQQPLQPRQQNRQVERLGQIIVRPRRKTFQHIFGPAARGQHEHRHIIPCRAQFRNHAEPIFSRQHNVEHDGIEVFFLAEQTIRGGLAIAHNLGGISLRLQIEAQSLRQMGFIFHHQNPAHAVRPRQFHRNRGALAFALAFGKHFAAMLLRNRLHNEQAQPGSFHMRQRAMADAVKALEDAFQIVGRNAHPVVLHAENNPLFVGRIQAHPHIHILAGIFDRIVENVENRGAEVLSAAQHAHPRAIARCFLIAQSFRRQMMPHARRLHAFAHQLPEIDCGFLPARSSCLRPVRRAAPVPPSP